MSEQGAFQWHREEIIKLNENVEIVSITAFNQINAEQSAVLVVAYFVSIYTGF